jgi:hypothetical protein
MKERRPIRWLVIEAEMDHVLGGGPGASWSFRGRFPGCGLQSRGGMGCRRRCRSRHTAGTNLFDIVGLDEHCASRPSFRA